uniref:Uncharacterized protein n=1 Tax=Paramormyrops kingsleyae TaxID=1676925 RepID=A0A3B3RD37_9TELE
MVKSCRKSELSFYRLPKSKERRSKLIAAILRNNWNPSPGMWICHLTQYLSMCLSVVIKLKSPSVPNT